jgi:hypothetical protein
MKKILFFSFLLLSINFYSQELTCADFKVGNFVVKMDSEKDPYKLIRYENYQIEIVNKSINETSEKENIKYTNNLEWIDDCTYKVEYDEVKMELNAFQKAINENGVLVKMKKIKGKYLYFDSFLSYEGKTIKLSGKMYKE